MSNYILTYSKIKFNPLEPVSDDINIKDIAHALSLMTRANGHFKHFYSVGQHSINCCKEAKKRGYSKRIQLGCLLHDASESYISDLTRPVKQNFREYFVIEEKLQGLIYRKFGLVNLSEDEIKKIKDIDDSLLYYEFQALMGEKIFEKIPYIAMKHDFLLKDFKTVENEFIYIYKFLNKNPNYKNKIVESHPEVCFAMLNFDGKNPVPIIENKKTKEGMNKRLDLLSKYYDKTEEIKSIIFSNPTLKNMKDDIVDALCLAVIGKLGLENGFKTIPENPMKDNKNIIMQMVYADLDF